MILKIFYSGGEKTQDWLQLHLVCLLLALHGGPHEALPGGVPQVKHLALDRPDRPNRHLSQPSPVTPSGVTGKTSL